MPGGLSMIEPVIKNSVRTLCTKPYPGHPNGCPNYGERDTCPPEAPLLADVIRTDRNILAVWNIFDLEAHTDALRVKHPEWSWAQLACCLYWQGGARKLLRERVEEFTCGMDGWHVLYCPEACGVDVTATMAVLGHHLQWPPKTKTYQVALVGRPV